MSIIIDDICSYAPKSGIKAGEATKDGQYMFFTSSEDESKRYTDYQYDGEGIIMGAGGNATLHYYHGKYAVSTDCIVLNPDDRIRCKYLYYFFRANMSILEAGFKGAGLKHTNKKYIGSITIPQIPPVNEQDRIIEVLDKITDIINARNLEMTALDDLIKARFVEMFGDETNPYNWPVVNVEDVANVSVGVVIKPAQYYTDAAHGVKAFRSLNIGPMTIKDGDWVYFSYEGNDKNAKSQLKENDLLIVRSGAPGTACVVPKQYEGCNAIDIIIARPNTEQVNSYYLCAYTNMPHGKRQIEEGTGGAAQQHFNVGKYNKLRLMLPPMSLQKEYVDFFSQVDKSKAVIQNALDKAQLLFDSLMQQFFG